MSKQNPVMGFYSTQAEVNANAVGNQIPNKIQELVNWIDS